MSFAPVPHRKLAATVLIASPAGLLFADCSSEHKGLIRHAARTAPVARAVGVELMRLGGAVKTMGDGFLAIRQGAG